ncbi:MAG: hypothetical protein ACO1SV_15160 [Fimbriimonas sp.]
MNKWRGRIWKGGLLATVVGGSMYAWSKTDVAKSAASLPAELSSAYRAGLPTSLGELRQGLRGKAGSNAAPYFQDAFVKGQTANRKLISVDMVRKVAEGKASAKELAGIRAELVKLDPALTVLEIGSRQSHLNYERAWEKGLAILFPDLNQVGTLTSALCLRALLHVKHRASLVTAARVARLMDDDPNATTTFVRFVVEKQIVQSALRLVKENPDDPAVRKLAGETLTAMGPFPDLRPKFGGELVVHRIGALQMDKAGYEQLRRDGANLVLPDGTLFLLRFPVVRTANEARVVRYWRELAEALPKDPEDVQGLREGIERVNAKSIGTGRTDMLLVTAFAPFRRGLADTMAEGLARRRVLRATLDVLDVHARTGRLPATVGVEDPFGGNLRIRPTAQGFTLYSVGPDGQDNGGKDMGKATTDIAATIDLK